MRKKRVVIAIAAISIAAIALLAWFAVASSPREPVYHGKSLSQLAADVGKNPAPFQEAVRAAGTNAVPVLLRFLQAHDSMLKIRLLELAVKQPLFKVHFVDDYTWQEAGALGFGALTNRAAFAVPELLRIFELKISSHSQQSVADSLGSIGPDARMAVPTLLRETGGSDPYVQRSAFAALADIHADPDAVVPVLIKGLQNRYWVIQYNSAEGLGNFGPAAKSAVPALVGLIKTSVPGTQSAIPEVRQAALEALKKIDPAAAEKLSAN